MGIVRKKVKLVWGSKELEVEALIDTGTNRLIVPRDIADALGLKPLFKVKAELADGSVKEVDVAPIVVEIMGRSAPDYAVIVEKGEVCVGVETLETLGLAVDPVTGELYPTRRFVWRI
ncbi:MAG: aspartyl protease family protein [Desulfurococcaceae archaeon]|jgi:clan AA aspartic protease|nr:aspartyl protease family protein [Desulfurococcaceae archaeon]